MENHRASYSPLNCAKKIPVAGLLSYSHVMDKLQKIVAAALGDFEKVAALARADVNSGGIAVEFLPKPHKPPSRLPAGQMAVYAFFLDGRALKVGKAGPNSGPRYISQHYNPNSARSNLARSILTVPERIGAAGVDTSGIGAWIKHHTDRVNLLVPVSFGIPMLSLLEAFLHVRWQPIFEGRTESD